MNIKKFLEHMVYKNLLIRIIFSFLIFLIYIFSITNKYWLLVLGVSIYLIIYCEIKINFKSNFYLIIAYLSISLISFTLFIYNFFDIKLFNLLIFAIISFDTLSYLFGSIFGRTYIFKYISPNKTLEGYFGGLLLTNILYLFYIFFNNNFFDQLINIILLNILIVFSLLGDLVESFFKRTNNIKDSSNFLPGHGGFFDRFDSFIPSIIFLTSYSFFYP